ncbi:hypothetical protein [Shewanella surugensis]|uniref:YrhK domain-containing protein n=1 Tax=Shewanella surugensis TaxID=212020 RepID=A0ABT0LF56_9GAMM|nr:hypothetical protein [Shewanella surugensis]MCL1126341.1 hypothetical protein [Shewanella surugensis]
MKKARAFPHYPRQWKQQYRHMIGHFIVDIEFKTHLGGIHHWNSRHHRKGLGMDHHAHIEPSLSLTGFLQHLWSNFSHKSLAKTPIESIFNPLNFWIGLSFIIGASHFVFASLLALSAMMSVTALTNLYFMGSIFFTIAAYLQYIQSINAGDFIRNKSTMNKSALHKKKYQRKWLAWQPHRLDFWVTFSQFIGTLFFNLNTFSGYLALSDLQQSLFIWLPNLLGSLCFQLSGSLALYETSHQFWLWSPKSLEQKMAFINHFGCLFFLGSAFVSSSILQSLSPSMLPLSIVLTCLGGICFLCAAVLLCRESIQIQRTPLPHLP